MRRCTCFVPSALILAITLGGCATESQIKLRPVENPLPPLHASVYDLGRVDMPPQVTYQQPPRYPFELRRANVQGKAMIAFVVLPDGSVTDVAIVKADDIRFGDAATAAVSAWKFHPAKFHGQPVSCRMMVPVVFSLDGIPAPAELDQVKNETQAEASVYPLAEVDSPPVATYQRPPTYPFVLRKAGIQGEATVDFIVTNHGSVAAAKVVRATDPRFGEAALACVVQWHFRPAMKDGAAVNCHMQVPIVFTINESPPNDWGANPRP
jgi:TonB family protein